MSLNKIFTIIFVSLVFATAAYANQAKFITPAFDKVNTGTDPKHTPVIQAPEKVQSGEWFDVTVTIGKEGVHPSFEEHHVEWIALFKNDVELSRIYLHPVHSQPKVTFTIALKDSATLKVMTAPNHTSAWVGSKKIKVMKSDGKRSS